MLTTRPPKPLDSVVKVHTSGELTPDSGTERANVTVLYQTCVKRLCSLYLNCAVCYFDRFSWFSEKNKRSITFSVD
jgi:hypothetical protein